MELWYPNAKRWIPKRDKRRDGPGKPYSKPNTVDGIVWHSAEGYVGGLHSVLEQPDSERVAAWHFSVLYNGTVEQHYPLDAVLWHAGSDYAHRNLIGVEHEGGFVDKSEPLRPAQLTASVELFHWIAEQGDFTLTREGTKPTKTLWEHKEISDTSTLCPSDRPQWDEYLKVVQVQAGYDFITDGENLYRFCLRHKVDMNKIIQLNPKVLANPNVVKPWQILRLTDSVPEPPLVFFTPQGGEGQDLTRVKKEIDNIQTAANMTLTSVSAIRGELK